MRRVALLALLACALPACGASSSAEHPTVCTAVRAAQAGCAALDSAERWACEPADAGPGG